MQSVTIGEGPTHFGLGPPRTGGDGLTYVPIAIAADGIEIRREIELQTWSGGPHSLTTFFVQLAERWRGWAGALDWNDDSGTVALSATHNGINEILLLVSVDPAAGWEGDGAWRAQIFVSIEPGSAGQVAGSVKEMLE